MTLAHDTRPRGQAPTRAARVPPRYAGNRREADDDGGLRHQPGNPHARTRQEVTRSHAHAHPPAPGRHTGDQTGKLT